MRANGSADGKVIVLSGATSGIGLAAAVELARRGATVIGIGRSLERCSTARASLQEAHPRGKGEVLCADLAAQRQVRRVATDIQDMLRTGGIEAIDVLINNAAVVKTYYTTTQDGYEMQFAVNHLAAFLLTHELLPALKRAPKARILTVSSRSHRRTRIRWGDVMLRKFYNPLLAYKQSKLANVMFSAEFNRRYASTTSIRAYAIDPGLVNTQIGIKDTTGIVRWVWQKRRNKGRSPQDGAQTILYLATEDHLPDPNALFWKYNKPLAPSPYALLEPEARRLWELSERLCGLSS